VTAQLTDVTEVSVLGRWRLRVTFSDGFSGIADLRELRSRGGVFAPLRNPAVFAQASVDPELGTVVWPNGADVAPERLRELAERGGPRAAPRRPGSRCRQLLRRAVSRT
jgi:hypothetical protein